MAIGVPSATGSNVEVSGTPIGTPMSVTVTITAGETGVAVIHFGAVGGAVSSITGGGTWTKICEITNNGLAAYHSELWATDPGAASSASSVSIAWTGSPEAIEVSIGSYPGILAWGNNATNRSGSASSNPNGTLTTQDNDNWLLFGVGAWDTTAFTVSGSNVIRKQQSGSGASDIVGGLFDTTRATPGSLTGTALHASNEWTWVGVEARSVAPGGGGKTPGDPTRLQQHHMMVQAVHPRHAGFGLVNGLWQREPHLWVPRRRAA
jgi:hypothetical protein